MHKQVDVRRYDHPIIYASPTFYKLTGYSEQEVLGKNCRFLQSPEGHLERGAERKFTSPEAVQHLSKSLSAKKECQASLINYRKGGHAFINLVTVIPVSGQHICTFSI
jgi:PAS domain S-box-containing protein